MFLIIGAAEASLGQAIVDRAGVRNQKVLTAGIQDEALWMDVTVADSVKFAIKSAVDIAIMAGERINLVVTAGINVPCHIDETETFRRNYEVNVFGLQNVLSAVGGLAYAFASVQVISSNSAHIARRGSVGYCSSKAAVSSMVRCVARDWGGNPLLFGYEPGLLVGTPMTRQTEAKFGPSQTRMVGAPGGLRPDQLAHRVVYDALTPWQGLNGTMARLDAGEQ